VTFDIPSPYYLGKSAELTLNLADPKSGLRRLRAGISRSGEVVLADVDFPTSGFLGTEKSAARQ
jgi:hypothetical protein